VLVGLAVVGVTLGIRAAWTFVRETARIDRGDARWFRRWPVGAISGRFAPHRGHFDPGQRLANVAFVASLATLIGSGVALTTLSGGPTFATMVRVHRAATVVLTALVIGHLVVVSGLLPGYRGAWRAMVGRGRVRADTARRLWPSAGSHRHRD
jgi:formate dehydrogenase subunit gamma